jgi:hypothetical protein
VDRDKFLAQTFRGLGHQIHLIQDAAAVPHARNEAHPIPPNIEKWTRNRLQNRRRADFTRVLQQTPRIFLDPELLNQTTDPLAPIPIGKFIDADRYTGENPNATVMLRDGLNSSGDPVKFAPFGLVEYTNANFVHKNTIFTDTLPQTDKWWSPYPRSSSTNLATLGLPEEVTAEDGQVDRTLYIRKERDGERIEHFLKPSYVATFTDELGRPTEFRLRFQLDDKVYEDYVRLLLPRAVGYSIGLLEYFFRGSLDFTVGPVAGSSNQLVLSVTNSSLEEMRGSFTLYADNLQDVRTPVDGAAFSNLRLGPGARSGEVTFTSPPQAKAYILVFQGQLGNEAGAVAGRVKSVPVIDRIEPNPAFAGDPTTIEGSGFDPTDPAKNVILFGGAAVPATAVDAAGTRLTFIAPDLPPPGTVTITSVTPNPPPVEGGVITITGTNFAGQPAPLRVTVGDSTSNAVDFSPGGATRVNVSVLTRFDTRFFLNLGNSATHPVLATVTGRSTAVATLPPLFDLAPPPDPAAIFEGKSFSPNGFRVGFTQLRLKLYDGSRSNAVFFSPFPQVTIQEDVFRPEAPVLRRSPVSIALGDTITEAIAEPREFHSFEFQGQEGQRVMITLDGREGWDPEFLLTGPGMEFLLFDGDDDRGPGLDAVLPTVTLPATGTYTIEVRSSFDTGFRTTGPYTLTVEEVPPPPAP